MSLRAIARELGVSATTVSLALRNIPRVSSALGDQIRRMARERGYVPNARVAELMGEVRKADPRRFQATLGAFSLYPEKEPWLRTGFSFLSLVLEGGRAAAEKHGYRLEHFWFKDPGVSPKRFRGILDARGIQGAFCLGSLDPGETLPRELSGLALIAQGASIAGRVHRVASHFGADARRLFDELQCRGYRRPGLAILIHGDRRTEFAYSAYYLSMAERHCPGPAVPILRSDEWDEASFDAWFRRHEPDVLVLHQSASFLEGVDRYLRRRRIRVPEHLGIALLDKNPDPQRYSGILQDPARVGGTAIEMLIGRILVRDFEPPEHPRVELVVGNWNEGRTLRPATSSPQGPASG
jgi:LacI family transcriptional regulator